MRLRIVRHDDFELGRFGSAIQMESMRDVVGFPECWVVPVWTSVDETDLDEEEIEEWDGGDVE